MSLRACLCPKKISPSHNLSQLLSFGFYNHPVRTNDVAVSSRHLIVAPSTHGRSIIETTPYMARARFFFTFFSFSIGRMKNSRSQYFEKCSGRSRTELHVHLNSVFKVTAKKNSISSGMSELKVDFGKKNGVFVNDSNFYLSEKVLDRGESFNLGNYRYDLPLKGINKKYVLSVAIYQF